MNIVARLDPCSGSIHVAARFRYSPYISRTSVKISVIEIYGCPFFRKTMEKNIGFGATSAHSSAPLPTAPPSYEEAIASAGEAMCPSVTSPPYPMGSSAISMPMPCK